MRGTHANGSAGVSGARPINRMLDSGYTGFHVANVA